LIEFVYFAEYDVSISTNEHQNGNESDTSSDDGELIIWELYYSSKMFICLEQGLLHARSVNVDRVDDDDGLTSNGDHRGFLDIFIFLIRTEVFN
jgi:hypothetical protein